jgi:hypothetical protein
MSTTSPADRMTLSPGSARSQALVGRLGPLDVLALSGWCGLAAGLLEVGTRVLCRSIGATNQDPGQERLHRVHVVLASVGVGDLGLEEFLPGELGAFAGSFEDFRRLLL